ncbi:MAG: extracellular solute-binding protein [Candidatus Moraniibacteriota bacterium]
MRFFSKKKFLSLASVVFGALLLSGCGFKSAPPESYQVKLEVWGVFDDSDAYAEIFGAYRKINPYVGELNYRKLPIETYQEDLLDALAAGKGPDIFMIRNAWRSAFEDKVATAPETFTEKEYRDTFVDVVANDFIKDGQIYGVPLSADSLALYYNKDIFNAAGIARPPVTWEELLSLVPRLNSIDSLGNVRQSAVALGTAYNINRSTDVLTAMMLQMGSGIGESGQRRIEFADDNSRRALEFYTQFANISSGAYSWNPRLHYSIDAFYEGTLGMMVNYSWHYATIKQKNAKLNFGTAPLPQFAGTTPTNFANYWGFAVAKNKATEISQDTADPAAVKPDPEKQNFLRVHEAWQFLRYMAFPHPGDVITLQNGIAGTVKDFPLAFDPTQLYLEKTGKPAARRDLIERQKSDVVFAPFALGNLIAKNWHQGNPEGVETVFAEMINTVNNNEKSAYDALSTAVNRIDILSR